MSGPPDRVLDLFAAAGPVESLPGGRGTSVRAGDLVLSPGRSRTEQDALSPVLARLAVELDSRPGRHPRDLRVALPVPARDGSWVVDGWAATRFEPDCRAVTDLPVLLATAALLHAELRRAVPRPLAGPAGDDRWSRAERLAFGPAADVEAAVGGTAEQALVTELLRVRRDADLGVPQLVHGDLAGNVLLDARGAPLVIDLAPYWRPTLWADAVCVLDAVLWWEADPSVMDEWAAGPRAQAMVRSALFRVLSDRPTDVTAYRQALGPVLG